MLTATYRYNCWSKGPATNPLHVRYATLADVEATDMAGNESLRRRASNVIGSGIRPLLVATVPDAHVNAEHSVTAYDVLCSPMGAVWLAMRHKRDGIVGW